MRATGQRRRAESPRRGGYRTTTAPVTHMSDYQRRLAAPCPPDKHTCPTCRRHVRLRADGRLVSHNHCPHGGDFSPIVLKEAS